MADWGSNGRSGAWQPWPFLRTRPPAAVLIFLLLFFFATVLPVAARKKDKVAYGEGLIVNIPLPESEVETVVQDIVQNGIIRGTKEYNKDEYVSGAKAATSCRVFPAWTEGGKVFYKVREQAIDPRNFKDSGDAGTLAVRYVVKPQGQKNTVLRIDALFEEEFRHVVHQSNGSVESNEFKDIQEHLEAIEVMKKQDIEAEQERQEQLARKQKPAMPTYAPAETTPQSSSQALPRAVETRQSSSSQSEVTPPQREVAPSQTAPSQTVPIQTALSPAPPAPSPSIPAPAGQTLEDRVKALRKQVERVVKAPGAPLKSAPFHGASTLQTLNTGTEVLILVSTTYWYGVETHEGAHGWIMRDELDEP